MLEYLTAKVHVLAGNASKDLKVYWDKGRPLPKFGEWDVNDPTSAEGFTVIFNKARDEKKTGGNPESPSKADPNKYTVDPVKPQAVKFVWSANMERLMKAQTLGDTSILEFMRGSSQKV